LAGIRPVAVKVADTQQLRNWGRSLGAAAGVMGPAGLREEITLVLQRQLAAYTDMVTAKGDRPV
jgi:hypothetical protein